MPNQGKIEKGLFKNVALEKMPQFDIFTGLQFETIVLNNLLKVVEILKIPNASVENAGPFIQTSTARQKGCQIDLLIQTKNTLYVCEIKARKEIGNVVQLEVASKIKALKRPSTLTIRPVLIYVGELASELAESDFFHQIIEIEEFF